MANEHRRNVLIERFKDNPRATVWVERLKRGECPLCGKMPKEEDFRHDLARTEFLISHLCMACQDDIFGENSNEIYGG